MDFFEMPYQSLGDIQIEKHELLDPGYPLDTFTAPTVGETSSSPSSAEHNVKLSASFNYEQQTPESTISTTSNIAETSLNSSIETSSDISTTSSTAAKKHLVIDKPPEPYADMIAKAILANTNNMLQLKEIYEYIEKNYETFSSQTNTIKWRNAVRHNLSSHKYFVKTAEKNAKGHFWSIHPSYSNMLRQAVFEGRLLKTLKIGSKFKRSSKKKNTAKSSTPNKNGMMMMTTSVETSTKKRGHGKSNKKSSQMTPSTVTPNLDVVYPPNQENLSNNESVLQIKSEPMNDYVPTAYYDTSSPTMDVNNVLFSSNHHHHHQGSINQNSLYWSNASPTPSNSSSQSSSLLYDQLQQTRVSSPYSASSTWSSSSLCTSYQDSAYMSSPNETSSIGSSHHHHHNNNNMDASFYYAATTASSVANSQLNQQPTLSLPCFPLPSRDSSASLMSNLLNDFQNISYSHPSPSSPSSSFPIGNYLFNRDQIV